MTALGSPIATYAVHRSAVVAEALHHRFGATQGLASSGWATSAARALYGGGERPDVWIVDECLAHSGATVLCESVDRDHNGGRVVVLAAAAGAGDTERVLPLLERGASGVVDVSRRGRRS